MKGRHIVSGIGVLAVGIAGVAAWKHSQIAPQVDHTIEQVVNQLTQLARNSNLQAEITRNSHQQQFSASTGTIDVSLTSKGREVVFQLDYQVQHGLSAWWRGIAFGGTLRHTETDGQQDRTLHSVLMDDKPITFNGLLKSEQLQLISTVPMMKQETERNYIRSEPITLSWTLEHPNAEGNWEQQHTRLNAPRLEYWKNVSSKNDGVLISGIHLESHHNETQTQTAGDVSLSLDGLSLHNKRSSLEVTDISLKSQAALNSLMNSVVTLDFKEIDGRDSRLSNGHIELKLDNISGPAMQQIASIQEQAQLEGWPRHRITQAMMEKLPVTLQQLLATSPSLTLTQSQLQITRKLQQQSGTLNINGQLSLNSSVLPADAAKRILDGSMKPAELVGALQAELHLNTDGAATDFARKLISPAGRAFQQAARDGQLDFTLAGGVATLDGQRL